MTAFVIFLVLCILFIFFWPYVLIFSIAMVSFCAIVVALIVETLSAIGNNTRKIILIMILGLTIFFIVKCAVGI